jgi:hypothetical protein
MSMRVVATGLAPDLRFGLAPAIADPGLPLTIGDIVIRAEGSLPPSALVPRHIRYADLNTVLLVDGVIGLDELERRLGEHIEAVGESGALDGLGAAIVVLDAVDRCFRESGLWNGNIYLAGPRALTAVSDLAGVGLPRSGGPYVISRELAALELAYLFPVARKFRSGAYDGQVQYRLNGWGRSVARHLASTTAGAKRAETCRQAIGRHLAGERQHYESFLSQLDVARQDYAGNRLDQALSLPIPVLV